MLSKRKVLITTQSEWRNRNNGELADTILSKGSIKLWKQGF